MERYSRQIVLDQIGEKGQKDLLNAHVVIVGCGGLGSIAAPYLAGAGVGKISLIDGDHIDISNLHRQVFYSSAVSQESKASLLARHIRKLNPDVEIRLISEMLSKDNIDDIFVKDSIVLECTDHILTKYLVNDYCHIHGIPLVYGAIHKYDGYLSFFENSTDRSIHLRDIFPIPNEEIPTCSEVGVLGTLAGIIGLLQANEAIKYITNAGNVMSNCLLTYNILSNDQMKLKLLKNYTENMKILFDKTTYEPSLFCTENEITYQELKENRKEFVVVSILEDGEHQDIDDEVLRMPLSVFDDEVLESYVDQKVVFYCMSGKRSGVLVDRLQTHSTKERYFSLKGGIRLLGIDRE